MASAAYVSMPSLFWNAWANYGVRMIARDEQLYNPSGYHYGSIWPLFTGWTALAMLKYGYREEGLKHLVNTLMLFKKSALGYIPEVLHGEQCKPAGVCPHQAWAEAWAVLGIVNSNNSGESTKPTRR